MAVYSQKRVKDSQTVLNGMRRASRLVNSIPCAGEPSQRTRSPGISLVLISSPLKVRTSVSNESIIT